MYYNNPLIKHILLIKYYNVVYYTDINECSQAPCDQNANCDNTPGSFDCTCNTGYVGNGLSCSGKSNLGTILIVHLDLAYAYHLFASHFSLNEQRQCLCLNHTPQ